MYYSYSDKIFQKNPEIEKHNLLLTFTKIIFEEEEIKENDKTEENEAQNNLLQYKTIDEIFSKYLVEVVKDCNKEYFEFITKFVVLFRECINKIKYENSINNNNNGFGINDAEEFSVNNNADTVPDICNEFITDFMESHDYFGLDTMELIEIIQHLCNWLYENKYTTSKLSLVS